MYAVIRAGGKQYRVAPGDVIKVEKIAPADNGSVEFSDVLAVSSEDGKIGGAKGETRVVGQVVEDGRNDKVLVFHYKHKKQYKKLQGHRQAFTAVRITQIAYDGQTFDAPEAPAPKARKSAEPKAAAPKRTRKTSAVASAEAPAAKPAAKKASKKSTAKAKK